jgi:hypothetical protein
MNATATELIDQFLAGLDPRRQTVDRNEMTNLLLDIRSALATETANEQ